MTLKTQRKKVYQINLGKILGTPEVVTKLINSYLEEDEYSEVDASSMFEITEAGCFFRHQLYSNCQTWMILVGRSFAIGGMLYSLVPCLILDLVIYLCKKIYEPEPDCNFIVTLSVYYVVTAIGALLGAFIGIIPAVVHAAYHALDYKFNEASQQAFGNEIYRLLSTLEKKDSCRASEIIASIIKTYEESFHNTDTHIKNVPAVLFLRDNKSETLYKQLKNPDCPQASKREAIEEFMEPKNKNAGKKMFNIILEELRTINDLKPNSFFYNRHSNDLNNIHYGSSWDHPWPYL